VHPAVLAKSMSEFLALARARLGQLIKSAGIRAD
jgi:hypothetical protein